MNKGKAIAVVTCVLAVTVTAGLAHADASTGDTTGQSVGERTFYMGFQDFSWDDTDEAADATYAFLRENADIVCLQFGEICPWQEAYENKPFPEELMKRMKRRKEGVGPSKKIYLEITPLNMGRAAMGGTISEQFKGKQFDDPMVKDAYVNYARRMIEYFHPDYLCIGVEVNELADNSPALWPHFVELHKHTYAQLKQEYPDLPVFASITLHSLLAANARGEQTLLRQVKGFLPYNDVAGISFYSFLGHPRPAHGESRDPAQPTKELEWVREFVGDMPIAITETAYPAEPIVFSNRTIPAGQEAQRRYLETLFKVAERDRYLFVINFAHRDYDAWWEKAKDQWDEWVKSWKDTGLLDGEGNPRPSYNLWKQYLSKRYAGPPPRPSGGTSAARPFYMGFQDATWDDTEEAAEATYEFLRKNADIICLQFGGVPWQAAYEDNYPHSMIERWKRRKEGVGPNKKIYLEIGPLDTRRAGMGGSNVGDFKGKPFDDPMVKKAYCNFVRRLTEYYQPAFLGIGIEVNELRDNSPELWPHYLELHKHTYKELKKAYPDLPITSTVTLHRLLSVGQRCDKEQIDAVQELLAYTDFAGVSFYPFIGRLHDFNEPTKYFDWLRDFVGDLPIAITETAYPAEPIAWGGETRYPSDPGAQKEYLATVLQVARRDKYLFVINWAHRDWDARWERVKDRLDEMWTAWRDTGLLDGEGNTRPAYDLWKQYFLMQYDTEVSGSARAEVP